MELPCVTMSLIVRNHSYQNVFPLQIDFHANQTFSYERICSRTRFETEARNLEMAFSTFHVYPTEQSPVMVFHASLFTVQVRSVRPQKNGGN